MKKFWALTVVSFLSLIFLTPTANGVELSPRPTKPDCRLEVQNAHLSKTIKKFELRDVVKVNVASICNVTQSRVLITLEIHKKGEFGDHIFGPFTNAQDSRGNSGLVVKLQDKYVNCENSIQSKWFGVAYSKALIGGRWLYAGKTQSPVVETLFCGN